MSGGFSNKPKILKGAFVEYGLSIPPLFVVFQFNPEQLSRSRNLSISAQGQTPSPTAAPATGSAPSGAQSAPQAAQAITANPLRALHQQLDDLTDIRERQIVVVNEETISFEIKLDATDKLNEGDVITSQFGLAPQLSTLELMVHPKSESLLGQALTLLGGGGDSFSFTRSDKPPIILFIWGRKRVMPVNINSMQITETEFSTDLNPVRATVAVNLTVIEGKNLAYQYTKAMKEVMSVLNLANMGSITDVIIPG